MQNVRGNPRNDRGLVVCSGPDSLKSAQREKGSMTDEPRSFGELLRHYRLAAGLTQEALAEKAGLSVRGLSDLERGLRQSPHPDTVRRLGDALGLERGDQLALASTVVGVPVAPALSGPRRCPRCERANSPEARFCATCGQALTAPVVDVSRVAPSPTAEGEHKLATLLCCQLSDAALLAQRLDADGLLVFMDHFFQDAEAEVQRFEGTVTNFLNDGLVALFGVPVAHEDHARRGVLAALGIQRRLTAWGGLLRMALHTGPVAVGHIGAGAARRPTAVGEATTVAAALQQQAAPGTIVISGATARMVTGYVRLEEIGPLTLSGGSSSIAAFRVTGVGPRRSPIEGLGARPLSQFVGRDREMGALHDLLAQAMGGSEIDARPTLSRFIGRDEVLAALREPLAKVEEGHGQVVGIVGEPGIGKSRLLYEFRRSLAGKRLTYLEGRCLSYGSGVPYLPILDLVRANCGILDADEPAAIVQKLRFGLQEVGLDPAERLPYLLHLFGAGDAAAMGQLSPEAIKARIGESLRTWTLRGSQQRPIILAVEDLHWIDQSSEEYLASLVESLAGASILLLCTWRPGYRAPWGEHSYVTQLGLRRLGPIDSLSVVRSAIGADRIPEPVARFVLERAEGNPFFLEELARAALEHGEVGAGTRIPDTIQGVLLARMDRLPEAPRRVLQTASVLGREFPLRLLEAVWHDEAPLAPLLQELQHLEFLYARTGQEPGFVFKHALTQDVAYQTLLPGRRQALHAAAGRAFEHLYADRLEDVYDRLAHHYSRTDDHDKAVSYLVHFADGAARKYAHADAATALREALRHIELSSSPQQDRTWLEAALRLAHSLYFLGRFAESRETLEGGQQRLEQVADARLSAAYHFWLAHTYSHLGDHRRTVEHAERAIVEAERCGDTATRGRAHYVLARSAFWSGANVWGVEQGARAVALLQQTGERWWLAQSYITMGLNYGWMGEFPSALEMANRASALGEAIGDQRIQSYALWNRGWYQAASGDTAAAIELCTQSLERSVDPFSTTAATGWLGYAYLEAGHAEAAVPWLEQSLASWTEFRHGPMIGMFTSWLAEAIRRTGDQERAAQLAQRAAELSRQVEFWWAFGWAERVLGYLALQAGDLDAAGERFGAALTTYQSIQSRFEQARTLVALGELARRRGDAAGAERVVAEARALFRAVGAHRYVERASFDQTPGHPARRAQASPTS
jgi:class 3 adenylate cyclase/tetratricopeptide (TPR) repeat protein/DNA-binding XRE family transcriptional regulator